MGLQCSALLHCSASCFHQQSTCEAARKVHWDGRLHCIVCCITLCCALFNCFANTSLCTFNNSTLYFVQRFKRLHWTLYNMLCTTFQTTILHFVLHLKRLHWRHSKLVCLSVRDFAAAVWPSVISLYLLCISMCICCVFPCAFAVYFYCSAAVWPSVISCNNLPGKRPNSRLWTKETK